MPRSGLALLLACVVLFPRAPIAQAPPLSGGWSIDVMRTLPDAHLIARLAWLQNELQNYRPIYGESWADKTRLDFLRQGMGAVRELLLGRRITTPDVILPSSGGGGTGSGGSSGGEAGSGGGRAAGTGPRGTQLNQPLRPGDGRTDTTAAARGTSTPNSSAPTSLVLPLIVVLTAAQYALCRAEGVSDQKCAEAVTLKALAGAAVSVVPPAIALISEGGAVIASGIILRAGAVGTALTVVMTTAAISAETFRTGRDALADLGAQRDIEAQRVANVELMTPEKMRALVETYRGRINTHRMPDEPGQAIQTAGAALASLEAQARTEFRTVTDLNTIPALATAACADRSKHPDRQAAHADQLAVAMEKVAAGIVANMSEARTLVATCNPDRAQRAKTLHGVAVRDLQTLEQHGNDARADLTDAAKFYPVIKAARANAGAAGLGIASLERLSERARTARTRVADAIGAYRLVLANAHAANTGMALSVATLTSLFPPAPPAHIAQGLRDVDDAYTRVRGNWLTEERLDALLGDADDAVSRITGLHREALRTLDDVHACNGMPEEMPAAMRTRLQLLASGISARYARGRDAVTAGADIPGKADACLASSPAPAGGGRLAGECTGAIDVSIAAGVPRTPFTVRVTVDPPHETRVTSVMVDNPGCSRDECRDMRPVRLGAYALNLNLSAPEAAPAAPASGVIGTFRLTVRAFSGDRLMCSGQSREIRVLAP